MQPTSKCHIEFPVTENNLHSGLKKSFYIYFLENKLIYSPGRFDFFFFCHFLGFNHNQKLEADMKDK